MTVFLSGLSLFVCALATVLFIVGLVGSMKKVKKSALALLGIAFVSLSTLLLCGILGSESITDGRAWFLIPMAWLLIGFGFIGYFSLKLDIFSLIVAPISFIFLFIALIFHHQAAEINAALSGPIFWIHLTSIFVGFTCIAFSAVAGAFFLWQERRLKRKLKITAVSKDLPSLMSLDKVNAFATNLGFPMYCLGVIAGFTWAHISWEKLFTADPKEIISLIVLGLYAYLFHQRQAHSASGRKPALLAITIFIISVLSILFVNTILPSHHSFKVY